MILKNDKEKTSDEKSEVFALLFAGGNAAADQRPL